MRFLDRILRRRSPAPAAGADPDASLAAGLASHQAGELEVAERAYRKALRRAPGDARAHHLLGVVLGQGGRYEAAEHHLREALGLHPGLTAAYVDLGNTLRLMGRAAEAVEAYRGAVSLPAAEPLAHRNLAYLLVELGRGVEAIAHFRAALEHDPEPAQDHLALADLLASQDELDAAVACYRAAIERDPALAEAHDRMGAALQQLRQFQDAVACHRQAIDLDPARADAHFNLGNALQGLGRRADAVACFRRAVSLAPGHARAYTNLGFALGAEGHLEQAAGCLRKALELNPRLLEAHNNLGGVLQMQAQLAPAMACYERALQLDPDAVYVRSNLLTCWNYSPGGDPEKVFALHRNWADRVSGGLERSAAPRYTNDVTVDRRLRVGYVSADFRSHSVSFFITPILEGHDRRRFEVFCYANVSRPDATTRRLHALADHWCDISAVGDEQVAALIRRHEIDILVDLAGHTIGNRLPLFARKPAPVQITYLGYPNTTGLPSMDYRFTDVLADPPGCNDRYYVEELVRLAHGFLCYRPDPHAPPVAAATEKGPGEVTFVSFNELLKVTEPVVRAWAEILRALPAARLLIKGTALGDPATRDAMARRFSDAGVATDRLALKGRVPSLAGHLALYHGADIALDTFPYNGTTTTCEALWMGVPVVTLAGTLHAGRVGLSLLTRAGLPELVAGSPAEYVELAVALARDPQWLGRLHGGLRARMQRSELMRPEPLVRSIEAAYRKAWRRWCRSAAG